MHKHDLSQRLFLLAVLTAFSFSCKSSPTGPHVGQNLQLSTDYVTCTEVWLKVAYSGQSSPVSGGEFKITRDGDTVLTGNLTGSDTTVIDTTAQPEQAYTYRAYRYFRNQVSDTSLPIQVTTMDTTSNNFTWQEFRFGGNCGSSTLSDVAIINDTLAYAVGEIYLQDSTTGICDSQPYCLAVWDGSIWNLMRLNFFPPGSIGDSLSEIGYSMFADGAEDIWIGGDAIFHYDGMQWTPLYNTAGAEGSGKMWAAEPGDVWFVGAGGSIVHYDGYTWNKIPSAITSTVNDVWGGSTGPTPTVFAVSLTQGIFALTANSATSALNWPGGDIGSIWFADTNQTYVGGNGVYLKDKRGWRRLYYRSGMYVNGLRGSGVNNIFAVGWGVFAHFNGSTWQEFPDIESNANLWSVAVTKDVVVAVGFTGGGPSMRGFVIIGRDN